MIQVKQYRDPWLGEKFDEIIGFYPREFYPLDNFSSFKVEVDGYTYSSLEEAYQSSLFMPDYPEIVKQIQNSHSAHEAQKIAHENRSKVKYTNEEKLKIMERLLRLKIEQNPYVLKKLLETDNYFIVEDSPKDNYWGWGISRDGQNNLGKLWMKLREEYRNKNNEKISTQFDKKEELIYNTTSQRGDNMENILVTLDRLNKNKEYDEVLKEIEKYISKGYGVDERIIRYYLRALIFTRRYDETYNFLKKYEPTATISLEEIARMYSFCYKTEDAERVLSKINGPLNEPLLPVKIYLRAGKVEEARIAYEEAKKNNFNGATEFEIRKYRNLLNNYYRYGAFIEMGYDAFLKKGNELEPGHIIFVKKDPICTRLTDNRDTISKRPYMIWKIKGDTVYMFPVSNQNTKGYILFAQNYPNSTGDRIIKRFLCITTLDNVLSVQDKVKENDFKEIMRSLFIATYYGGEEERKMSEEFIRSYNNEPNIHDIIVMVDTNTENNEHYYYFVLDKCDEGYTVVKIDYKSLKVIDKNKELFSKEELFYRIITPTEEEISVLLSQLSAYRRIKD